MFLGYFTQGRCTLQGNQSARGGQACELIAGGNPEIGTQFEALLRLIMVTQAIEKLSFTPSACCFSGNFSYRNGSVQLCLAPATRTIVYDLELCLRPGKLAAQGFDPAADSSRSPAQYSTIKVKYER